MPHYSTAKLEYLAIHCSSYTEMLTYFKRNRLHSMLFIMLQITKSDTETRFVTHNERQLKILGNK